MKPKQWGPGNQKPLSRAEVVEEVEHLLGLGVQPWQVGVALKRTPASLSKTLRDANRPDLARRFSLAADRDLYENVTRTQLAA